MSNQLQLALLRLAIILGSQRLLAVARNLVLGHRSKAATFERIAQNPQRQLLVDVSVIASHDAGTGIQRAVRSLLVRLIAAPPDGFEVRPVRATRRRTYEYADAYLCSLRGVKPLVADQCIRVTEGDIFLGLDLAGRIIPRRQSDLLKWRGQGVRLCFVVYDLLPLTSAKWFTTVAQKSFRLWLQTLSVHADAVFCISRTVAEETRTWLDDKLGTAAHNLAVRWFHLGADLHTHASPLQMRLPAGLSVSSQNSLRQTVMMVGTLEPRKGHTLVLDAFDILWANGCSATLVIIGKMGWHVENLVERLRTHQQWGKHLIWQSGATDDELSEMYLSVDGLIVASEAEGFGLPLIEAASFGLPILARDIPVFREVAEQHATYFAARSGAELAPEINEWLARLATRQAPSSEAMQRLTWSESAEQLKHLLADLA
ncbi:D-inositol-3-phosphate glycosyltransferase [Paraburkholderia ultramafica]|uniref:D-inositol-3-phosphate glycosyltransferase n=1 Tax=Paraburkholderia ultramafica TaxID=1544867 RepID=A0A6S7BF92_9BURK|nr:glycosyltransferase family 1 protein [Paraburkholderia ultramafica]CAB3789270.1 D-inositol-3-phosphate glycosyltransferase [Paraburkholderia ultramafica]